MKKTLPVAILCLVFLYGCMAQSNNLHRADGKVLTPGNIDATIKKLMDTAEVTGLCLGIINDNKIAYVKTYGYKNPLKTQYIDTATCFYAASLAKPLFAYIVMQLVDEGKLELDKPLYTYLPHPIPDYEDYNDLKGDERWKLITARHCLSHTTGFPNWRFLNPRDNDKLEIFFTPGERYAYSGEGLFLLQMVIEKITGRSLEDLAQENVFKPFGMTRTSFLWQPHFENNYAVGFDNDSDPLRKSKRTSENAAGSMETTIADYTRFMQAVLQKKRLTQKSWNEMFKQQIGIYTKREFPSLNNDTTSANRAIQLSYGLGWGLFISPYGKAFFKEGHDDGWEHYCISFPDKKSSFIIMTNSSNGESIFKELTEKLVGVNIPWEWEGYIPYRGTVQLPATVLQQYTGEYTGQYEVTVSLENEKLKIASPKSGLPKTTMHAIDENHFFIKLINVDFEFVKGPDGSVQKMLVNDEGEMFELKKAQ